jgi:GMP synthase-like glutamine amidotransferase
MTIHVLENEKGEDEAYIKTWAAEKGISLSRTRLYMDEALPQLRDFDALIIMGGSMNVYEEGKYPFLVHEKKFIEDAVNSDKKALGICLGSQLLSVIAGGAVTKNPRQEIGWLPVTLTGEGKKSKYFKGLPSNFITFHWHGDTFSIPPGGLRLAGSSACFNQAFSCGGNILGIQFHPEITLESVSGMNSIFGAGLLKGPSVQSAAEIIEGKGYIGGNNIIMGRIMENFLF